MNKKVLINVKEELLRLGYAAVLEIKEFSSNCDLSQETYYGLIMQAGDDLINETSFIKQAFFEKAVYIVSKSWEGVLPNISAQQVVLRAPVTAEELINALNIEV